MASTRKITKREHQECEGCPKTNVDVFLVRTDEWYCEECRDADAIHAAKAKELSDKSREAASMIYASRKQDETIVLKQDIYTAKIPAAIELKAAIDADDSIPADQKRYAYAKETERRALHLRNVLMPEMRKQLNEMENEYRVWAMETTTNAAQLRTEVQAEFTTLSVSYSPAKVKVVKPKAIKVGTKTVSPRKNMVTIMEVAKKYDVPASAITMICKFRGMTPDEAAKEYLKNAASVRTSASN